MNDGVGARQVIRKGFLEAVVVALVLSGRKESWNESKCLTTGGSKQKYESLSLRHSEFPCDWSRVRWWPRLIAYLLSLPQVNRVGLPSDLEPGFPMPLSLYNGSTFSYLIRTSFPPPLLILVESIPGRRLRTRLSN